MRPALTDYQLTGPATADRAGAVQAGFLKQLPDLVAKYAALYEWKPADKMAVGTVSHMHAPDWTLWLRLDADYVEAERQKFRSNCHKYGRDV